MCKEVPILSHKLARFRNSERLPSITGQPNRNFKIKIYEILYHLIRKRGKTNIT